MLSLPPAHITYQVSALFRHCNEAWLPIFEEILLFHLGHSVPWLSLLCCVSQAPSHLFLDNYFTALYVLWHRTLNGLPLRLTPPGNSALFLSKFKTSLHDICWTASTPQ